MYSAGNIDLFTKIPLMKNLLIEKYFLNLLSKLGFKNISFHVPLH